MKPYFQDGGITIYAGDCLDVMPTLEPESVDAVVTDPPYHLTTGKKGGTGPASVNLDSPYGRARITTGFMGKAWDGGDIAFRPEVWEAVYRLAKPGAHLLAFGGTRTAHRLVCAIEDAGWEIRDTIGWVFGSGFPKSLDVSKAIDKEAGAKRSVVGNHPNPATPTEAAKQWASWGTALKPAWENITLARKPLVGTVAQNVQRYGTGALNIDASRIPATEKVRTPVGYGRGFGDTYAGDEYSRAQVRTPDANPTSRWPANLIHDGSEEVLECFPESAGQSGDVLGSEPSKPGYHEWSGKRPPAIARADSGSAARFFYCAKASRSDRYSEAGNDHPTVKPEALLRYLIRLITPPGGLVLDPFLGSGTTSKAAHSLGFRCIGIDLEERHCEIAAKRLSQGVLDFGGAA